MPVQYPNFGNIPFVQPDYSGITNFIPQALQAYQNPFAMRHERMINEEKLKEQAFKNALNEQFGEREKEADIAYKLALAANQERLASGLGVGAGQGGGVGATKQYAPTYTTKMLNELEDARAGFMPGTNRTVPITPEQQREIVNRLELSSLKHTTDVQTRNRSLFASNIDKAFERTNLDDLTYYSGLKGTAELHKDKGLDAIGKAPEKYKKYQEALTASEAEAKEIRQFFGDSITPQVQEALAHMTNPTGIATSPEVAKRKIEKARSIIREQLKTYREGLQGSQPYLGGSPEKTEAGGNEIKYQNTLSALESPGSIKVKLYTIDDPNVLFTAKKYNIAPEKAVEILNRTTE